MGRDRSRYVEDAARYVFGAYMALVAVVFAVEASHAPSATFRVAAGVLSAPALVMVWRASRTATLLVDTDSVTARSLFRERSISLSEIEAVTVVPGIVGAYRREYLDFSLTGGRRFAFKSLNSNPRKANTPVQLAATAVCRRLATPRDQ